MNTIGEWLNAIVDCDSEEKAKDFVAERTKVLMEADPRLLREQARTVVMENIGYLSGYLGRDVAGRVLGVFGARHPYFGAIEDWPKDPEDIIAMGIQLAEQKHEKRVRS